MTDGANRRRLPDAVVGFASELRALIDLLDPGHGWYRVFLHRDPDGVRACAEGSEVPPWDVVEALLQDLRGGYGPEAADQWEGALRESYPGAVAAYDRELSGRDGLEERLRAMLDARAHARRRVGELTAALSAAREADDAAGADRVSADLAWARDDLNRAAARCRELTARLDALPPPAPQRRMEPPPDSSARSAPSRAPAARVPAQRRKPRGARFAGLDEPADTPAAPTDAFGNAVPTDGPRDGGARTAASDAPAPGPRPGAPEAPRPGAAASPRGARFAGVRHDEDTPAAGAVPRPREAPPQARREVAEAVGRLGRLRADGRGGEAHALLCESAGWPPDRLPLLAEELERGGLSADVAVLLWEVACLPPRRLAAAADALVTGGRAEDCRQLLRQSVSRPVPEVAEAALALCETSRQAQATDLLAALVRARPAEEAAAAAAVDPEALPPLLRAAARSVSFQHGRDIDGLLARET